MHKVFLALGSNVGEKENNIKNAITSLGSILKNIQVAPFYISKAVGYTDQDDFVNTALVGYTDLKPQELLKQIKELEQQLGRKKRFRWGPREIDIDIIFYDNLILQAEMLEIPHPRMHERDFVLQPVIDLEPNYLHPLLHKTVQQLLVEIPKNETSIQS